MQFSFPLDSLANQFNSKLDVVYIPQVYSKEVIDLLGLNNTDYMSKLSPMVELAKFFLAEKGVVIVAFTAFTYNEKKSILDKVFQGTKDLHVLVSEPFKNGSFPNGFLIYTPKEHNPFGHSFTNLGKFIAKSSINRLKYLNLPSVKFLDREYIFLPERNILTLENVRFRDEPFEKTKLQTFQVVEDDVNPAVSPRSSEQLIFEIILAYLDTYFIAQYEQFSVLDLEHSNFPMGQGEYTFYEAVAEINTKLHAGISWLHHPLFD